MQELDYSLSVGSVIGDYRIIDILGVGGFGITYKAQDIRMQRLVALKEFLPQELAGRSNDASSVIPKTNCAEDYQYGLTKFLDEARTLAKFNHPNIVRAYTFVEANGTAYLVMEYVEGEALDEHLKKIHFNGNMAESRIREIIEPILNGLSEVHKAGLLHRDIKPGNIYLKGSSQDKCEPMLIDFGAARQSVGEKSKSISAIISQGYAPPEQYTTRGKQGPYTDIYAIGAVMYYLATGNKPVESTDRQHDIMGDEPDPLPPIISSLYSEDIKRAIEQSLILVPKNRCQNVAQMQQLLAGKGKGEQQTDKDKDKDNPPIDNDATRKITRDKTPDNPKNSAQPAHTQSTPTQTGKLNTTTKTHSNKKVIAIVLIALLAIGGFFGFTQYQSQQAEALAHQQKQAQQQEQQRIKAKQAADKLAAEKAERERLAQIAADKAAAEKAERDRLAQIAADKAASEKAERDRLAKIEASKVPLTITTSPNDATITLLNIPERYQAGVRLLPKNYQIKISKAGYISQTQTFNLKANNNQFSYQLIGEKPVDKTYTVGGVSFTMKAIPAGSFQMGCVSGKSCQSNENPVHQVTLAAFHMMETEVTWSLYQQCINSGSCDNNDSAGGDEGWGKGSRPVINVSFDDITNNFIPWLNKRVNQQAGQGFSLPSEAQWEYAARADTKTQYSWGNSIDCSKARYGYYSKECGKQYSTDPAKSISPNAWGLYDMHGNVWEWAQDCWNNSYQGAPSKGQPWLTGHCDERVLRGGSWSNYPFSLRSAYRSSNTLTKRNYIGFRLVLSSQSGR